MSATTAATPMSGVLRALSPTYQAQTFATAHTAGDTGPEIARAARQQVYYGANSLQSVIAVLPGFYQEEFTEPLRNLSAHRAKYHSVKATHTRWSLDKATGRFPPHLSGTAPKIQFTTEFRDKDEASTLQKKVESTFLASQNALLSDSIEAKWRALSSIENEMAPNRLYSRFKVFPDRPWLPVHVEGKNPGLEGQFHELRVRRSV